MPFCAGFGRICARWGSNFCRNSRRFHRSCNNSPPLGDGPFRAPSAPSAPTGTGPVPSLGAALPPPVPTPAGSLPAGDGHDIFCNNPAPK